MGIAKTFARAGMNVVITDIKQQQLPIAESELKAITDNVLTLEGEGGGPQHAGLADLAGPGGGDVSGRGGGEGRAAGVAWAEPSPAEASELWEGSAFDDGASVVSGVSFTSVTTARGWPRVAPPAPGAAAPTGMEHLFKSKNIRGRWQ